MRRLLVCLLLFALLALPACRRAELEAVATEFTTTETESQPPLAEPATTEIETTIPSERTTILMETGTALVFEKGAGYTQQEIWLRDKATGEEALLLGCDEYEHTVPFFTKKINDRYFAYRYAVPETDNISSVVIFDLQKSRTLQIDYSGCANLVFFDHVVDEKIYLRGWIGENELREYTIDIAALDSDGPIIPKEVR